MPSRPRRKQKDTLVGNHVRPYTSLPLLLSYRVFSVTLLFGNMSPHPGLFWICFLASLFVASIVLNAQVYLLGVWADQYAVESSEPEASMWR